MIGNSFNYPTTAKYVQEFDYITETIIAEKQSEPEYKYYNVEIYYYSLNKHIELADKMVIEKVKEGSILIGEDYKKDIKGYHFKHSKPKQIIVNKNNNKIYLYYKEGNL